MMEETDFRATALLLAAALAVGGAGVQYPLLGMALDLVALGVAGVLLWRGNGRRLAPLSRWALALVAATFLLPVLQLAPLPPALWQALPGRELAAEIDKGVGISVWRPVTLDIEGTIRAILTLIPACVVFAACLRFTMPERRKLLMVVAAFALLSAVLGIAQLASGGRLTPYQSAHTGYPIGLFVNRNHNALFLLISMPIIAALAAGKAQQSKAKLHYIVATLALLTILAVVTIATTSRMALVLLVLALAGSLLILFFRQSLWRTAVPAILVLGGVAAVISWIGGFNRNLARFSSLHDARLDYWDDVAWALHHYGLAGTGFGTFVPVYQTAESLSGVSPAILNHAHNDFIEIALEGGIPALILLAAFFAIIAVAAVRLRKRPFQLDRALVSLAAATGIVLILALSLVDYPLRMPAISCAFAVLCACLMPSPIAPDRPSETRRNRVWIMRGVGSAVVAAAVLVVVESGVSARNLLADRDAEAAAVAPWSTAAHDGLADDALAGFKAAEANEQALAALRLSPIDAGAVRTIAMVRILSRDQRSGQQLMGDAVVLGWRDPFTQLWAIEASARAGEPDKAIERAEALFQQEMYLPSSLGLLVKDVPGGPVSRALVDTLAARPQWRTAFFKAGAQLPPATLDKFTLLAAKLNATKAPLSTVEAKPLLARLIASGEVGRAADLWSATRRDGLVANGGFEQLSERNGADVPTAWDISDEDLATIAIQPPPSGAHGRALRISSAARSGPFLSQRLMLRPGNYILRYRARTGAAMLLRWDLQCQLSGGGGSTEQLLASNDRWQSYQATFTVPNQDCPIQTLALERPNDIHADEVWLDDLVLQPDGN